MLLRPRDGPKHCKIRHFKHFGFKMTCSRSLKWPQMLQNKGFGATCPGSTHVKIGPEMGQNTEKKGIQSTLASR